MKETKHYMKDSNKGNRIAGLFLVVLLIVGFLISLAAGCEEQYIEWITK